MDLDKNGIPDIYLNEMSTLVRGAIGPSFIVPFEIRFVNPKSIDEIFEILDREQKGNKGVSIYLNEKRVWLVFCFRKFHSVSTEAPVAEIKIGR